MKRALFTLASTLILACGDTSVPIPQDGIVASYDGVIVDGGATSDVTASSADAMSNPSDDADGDGFADAMDCDPGDRHAFPGQSAFFVAYSSGVKTWDYDCDGTVTYRYPVAGAASLALCDDGCNPKEPWLLAEWTYCGERGWGVPIVCERGADGCCVARQGLGGYSIPVVQSCH